MGTSQRRKGSYHENKVLEWIKEQGFKAKKQPLSGQLGGEYRGDLLWEIGGRKLVTEVKYRDASNFPNAFTVLDERDIAVYRRKTGEPKTVVIIDGDLFAEHFAPLLQREVTWDTETLRDYLREDIQKLAALFEKKTPEDTKRKAVPADWLPSEDLMQDINNKMKEDINHDSETIKFRDYHRAKGSKFVRFDSAYRTWCRNAVKFRQAEQSRSTSHRGQGPAGGGQETGFFSQLSNKQRY